MLSHQNLIITLINIKPQNCLYHNTQRIYIYISIKSATALFLLLDENRLLSDIVIETTNVSREKCKLEGDGKVFNFPYCGNKKNVFLAI